MSYRYNGAGERVHRTGSGKTVHTVFDPQGHWIGDYDAYGQPLQQAIWLGDLPVGLVARIDGLDRLFYIEPDALGSPRVVIDPTRDTANGGMVVWRWPLAGDAFGEEAPLEDPDGDGTAFVLDQRFPGQQYDSATGFNYNYFRDYDPSTGRYVESDPIGLRGGVSTFGYVEANPLTYYDLLGLQNAPIRDWYMWHYYRNGLNRPPPNRQAATAASRRGEWRRLPDWQSSYHQQGPDGSNNTKWVSCPDAHHEAVYNEDGELVTDQVNSGTYNFASPDDWFDHFIKDVLPYWLLGNGPVIVNGP